VRACACVCVCVRVCACVCVCACRSAKGWGHPATVCGTALAVQAHGDQHQSTPAPPAPQNIHTPTRPRAHAPAPRDTAHAHLVAQHGLALRLRRLVLLRCMLLLVQLREALGVEELKVEQHGHLAHARGLGGLALARLERLSGCARGVCARVARVCRAWAALPCQPPRQCVQGPAAVRARMHMHMHMHMHTLPHRAPPPQPAQCRAPV
jgi:hypothetical protein